MDGQFTRINGTRTSKWPEVINTIRSKRIGILALQETHLTDESLASLQQFHGRDAVILNSADPDRPSASAGVAFVLNRQLIDTADAKATTIIPGRAYALTLTWYGSEKLTMLNVYAPNQPSNQPAFWQEIVATWTRLRLPRPDFMGGDCNHVEDQLDRAPMRYDSDNATEALRDLRYELRIHDAWRNDNPTERMFTYRYQNPRGEWCQSRLDRIYSAVGHETNLFEWANDRPSITTDHDLITVRYAPRSAPQLGKGRWTWPLRLLSDDHMMSAVVEKGLVLQEAMKHPLTNKQLLWKDYKE
ncbi:DNase I-like protein, partial [Auriscalpium vulgare]